MLATTETARLGAVHLGGDRCGFRVWAPHARAVELHLQQGDQPRLLVLDDEGEGYHAGVAEGASPGSLYSFRLDGGSDRPDPASRSQPQGVHGPSRVVDRGFPWTDEGWWGLPLSQYVVYELHVGTFTQEGTFDAAIAQLDRLKALGVTAVELMPVAQFPGDRNWGYDGVSLYAAQDSYGGVDGLRRLVNACHERGLAAILDVVYNHLGPEGNYLAEFGPYFTDRYHTPWGPALNFDGPESDHVRRFFIENALWWVEDCHFDALRLDAVHAILDYSALPFIEELALAVHEAGAIRGRQVHVIAETTQDDPRLLRSREAGGYGLDGLWNDEFHHALHTLLTGEHGGYYQDYGSIGDLAKAYEEGFVYSGQYSQFRRRRHGVSSRDIPAERFVVFSQNHDQVGNRADGTRLTALVSFEQLKLAAGAVLLSPFVPLLFMGEEYGETAPFLYFVSHSDPELIEAVRRGRRDEFIEFAWREEPPDPQAASTFRRSKIDPSLAEQGHHRVLNEFYAELLRLRREIPALADLNKEAMQVIVPDGQQTLALVRRHRDGSALVALNLTEEIQSICLHAPEGRWRRVLDSGDERWMGSGASSPETLDAHDELTIPVGAHACALFVQERVR